MLTHLYEIVLDRAQRYPDAIALGGQQDLVWRTITSRQLLDLTANLADELSSKLGIQAGDRVVTWLPNHWRTPVYLFALWRLGAIVVPFDREMNPSAAATILKTIDPRAVLVGYGERPSWVDGPTPVSEWWEPRPASVPEAPTPWVKSNEELAALFFTSGTTGNPKGCMITHANLVSQIEVLPENIPLDPSCRMASILPLSHLFELTGGLLYPLSRGAAIHYIPSRRGPDVVRVLSEQKITHMIAVPQLLSGMGQALEAQLRSKLPAPLYRALNAAADRLPLPARHALFFMVHRKIGGQLRMMASGGAALPAETQRVWERLGVRVVQGYGTSECSPIVACGSPDGSTPIGSVGHPLRGVEVRLSPEGELQVRGPNVMRGYWRDPERTAEVLDSEGWYSTGDLATIDGNGNVTLSGRSKELIVLPSGLNLWPSDVEDTLRSHPSVGDAVLVPSATASGGMALHAYLIPRESGTPTSNLTTIVAECNGRLAQHQRLASASWWTEPDFPRTSTLKVKRHLLPPPDSQQESVTVEAHLAGDDPVGQAIAGAARVRTVQEQQTLAELGLDSLGLVDLALALEEKTGRRVGDGDLKTEMAVAQVRTFIESAQNLDGTESADDAPPQPLWPYTWGRMFRVLALPLDLIFRYGVTRTTVLGGEHLRNLPNQGVVFAGTHRGFPDISLIRIGLGRTPARRFANRLVIAAGADGVGWKSIWGKYAVLALGLYALQQRRGRDASLRGLAKLAAAGNAVLIFPQGQHTHPSEEAGDPPKVRFRPGFAHVVFALDGTVVPFGLAGCDRIMPTDVTTLPWASHRGHPSVGQARSARHQLRPAPALGARRDAPGFCHASGDDKLRPGSPRRGGLRPPATIAKRSILRASASHSPIPR